MGKLQEVSPDVWRAFKKCKDPARRKELRNDLIEKHLPLVRYTAERIRVKLPNHVELDDLMSAGIFGLIDAIEGFDLTRNVKFKTFCTMRIRGAILDELRSFDWVPRLVRSKANQLESASRELETAMGRAPTDEELASKLNLTMAELDEFLREASAVAMFSFSDDRDDSRSTRTIDMVEDSRGSDPVDRLLKDDVLDYMTRDLNLKERLIVLLYYCEELTMREIGLILDLSESRVCQLHSRIILRLKKQFEGSKLDLLA